MSLRLEKALENQFRLKLKKVIKEFSYAENFEKPYVLSSGERSPYYVDLKKVLFIPEYLEIASRLLMNLILKQIKILPSAAAGLTMGSDPLLYSMSLIAFKEGHQLYPLIVRKKGKDHGSKKKIEGCYWKIKEEVQYEHQNDQKEEVILIDDVVTSGKSTFFVYQALEEIEIKPRYAFCIVDRSSDEAHYLKKVNIPLFSLYTLDDFSNLK